MRITRRRMYKYAKKPLWEVVSKALRKAFLSFPSQLRAGAWSKSGVANTCTHGIRRLATRTYSNGVWARARCRVDHRTRRPGGCAYILRVTCAHGAGRASTRTHSNEIGARTSRAWAPGSLANTLCITAALRTRCTTAGTYFDQVWTRTRSLAGWIRGLACTCAVVLTDRMKNSTV